MDIEISSQFRQAWRAGDQPRIEDYLQQVDAVNRSSVLRKLINVEQELRREQGDEVATAEYDTRFAVFLGLPDLGRYRAEWVLGTGSFGTVYLALDKQLERQVAVKVPHPHIKDVDQYLTEARTLARLDHPGIVPVYDVVGTHDAGFQVVTKYIDGESLDRWIASRKITFSQTAKTISQVAEALDYAHREEIFHRDIKPANILIDTKGKPYLVDFGMALRLEDLDERHERSGTPRYMSPEQARGESGLLDGRSDIFSLGVVLYEMLTGKCPFQGKDQDQLLGRIIAQRARPPRSIDGHIPQELERICLKALSKDPAHRYTTAFDMSAELGKCVTYTPQPIDVTGLQLPESVDALFEQLAEHSHDIWAEERIAEGWEYGDVRDDARKMHPDLVPYSDLPEKEKKYDRRSVDSTLKAIMALGYEIRQK